MNETIELIHRELDYQATYNGVSACGETPTEAIENAKKKWQLMEEVKK